MTIRAGVVDKSLFTDKQLSALADLPSKEVLQAQLLGLLQTPATMLVRTLNESGASLARLLQAYVDKQGGAPAELLRLPKRRRLSLSISGAGFVPQGRPTQTKTEKVPRRTGGCRSETSRGFGQRRSPQHHRTWLTQVH